MPQQHRNKHDESTRQKYRRLKSFTHKQLPLFTDSIDFRESKNTVKRPFYTKKSKINVQVIQFEKHNVECYYLTERERKRNYIFPIYIYTLVSKNNRMVHGDT